MCIIGSTIIVVNAPEEKQIESVKEITDEMGSNLGASKLLPFKGIEARRGARVSLPAFVLMCGSVFGG